MCSRSRSVAIIARRTVVKNFISSLNGLAATLVFATHDAILWPQTLALATGTIGGGLIGAYAARVIPRNVVRFLSADRSTRAALLVLEGD